MPFLSKLWIGIAAFIMQSAPKSLERDCSLFSSSTLLSFTSANYFDYSERNEYGDEEAVIVARTLPSLRALCVEDNDVGWEGVAVMANGLVDFEELDISSNKAVVQGTNPLGRLPIIKQLLARTRRLPQETSEWRIGP